MKQLKFAPIAVLGAALALAACAAPPVTTTTTEQTTTGPAGAVPPPLVSGAPGTVTTQTTNAQTNP